MANARVGGGYNTNLAKSPKPTLVLQFFSGQQTALQTRPPTGINMLQSASFWPNNVTVNWYDLDNQNQRVWLINWQEQYSKGLKSSWYTVPRSTLAMSRRATAN